MEIIKQSGILKNMLEISNSTHDIDFYNGYNINLLRTKFIWRIFGLIESHWQFTVTVISVISASFITNNSVIFAVFGEENRIYLHYFDAIIDTTINIFSRQNACEYFTIYIYIYYAYSVLVRIIIYILYLIRENLPLRLVTCTQTKSMMEPPAAVVRCEHHIHL